MEYSRIRVMEHLAVKAPLSLQEFCDLMKAGLGLPDFEFDFENETEWGLVEVSGIEYNVSRPYESGTLEEWDGTVPVGCNFGITLMVAGDTTPVAVIEHDSDVLAEFVGQKLADALGRKVYHHRTWIRVGRSVPRARVFLPTVKRP